MRKKVYILIGISVVCVVICFLICSLFGYLPIFGRYIAETKLNAYTNDKLSVQYNFLDNIYIATDSTGSQLRYDLRANTIYDESHNIDIETQANEKYQLIVTSPLYDTAKYPSNISVWVQMDAKDTSVEYIKLYLMTVFDSANLSEEDSIRRMLDIVENICETINLNITAIQFMYANYDGMYELTCDFGNKSVLQSDLKNYIRKIDDKELPLDYIEWRENK